MFSLFNYWSNYRERISQRAAEVQLRLSDAFYELELKLKRLFAPGWVSLCKKTFLKSGAVEILEAIALDKSCRILVFPKRALMLCTRSRGKSWEIHRRGINLWREICLSTSTSGKGELLHLIKVYWHHMWPHLSLLALLMIAKLQAYKGGGGWGGLHF